MNATSTRTPKTPTINPFLMPALLAVLNLIPAGRVRAQTFTTLYSFTATYKPNFTNGDGAFPYAGLIANSSGNTLYGAAAHAGISGNGTVFAVNTDGTGLTNLHRFNYSDGVNPRGELILSNATLYGTAAGGGSWGWGTVFKVNTDGSGFTNLHSFTSTHTNSSGVFTNNDGANSQAGLILSGNIL